MLFWGAAWLIGMLVLNIVASILMIGRPREPITPGSALFTSALNVLFIAIVVGLVRAAGL